MAGSSSASAPAARRPPRRRELRRRRDGLGVTYFAVGEAFADGFAPVIELLAGRED